MEKTKAYSIIIDHPGYNEDVMIWPAELRHDMLKLVVLRRKLDMAKDLGLGRDAAYSKKMPGGTGLIEEVFGAPNKFHIEEINGNRSV